MNAAAQRFWTDSDTTQCSLTTFVIGERSQFAKPVPELHINGHCRY